jgi:hypothetical protein
MERKTDRMTDKWTDKWIDKQINRKMDLKNRWTGRKMEKGYRQTDIWI